MSETSREKFEKWQAKEHGALSLVFIETIVGGVAIHHQPYADYNWKAWQAGRDSLQLETSQQDPVATHCDVRDERFFTDADIKKLQALPDNTALIIRPQPPQTNKEGE